MPLAMGATVSSSSSPEMLPYHATARATAWGRTSFVNSLAGTMSIASSPTSGMPMWSASAFSGKISLASSPTNSPERVSEWTMTMALSIEAAIGASASRAARVSNFPRGRSLGRAPPTTPMPPPAPALREALRSRTNSFASLANCASYEEFDPDSTACKEEALVGDCLAPTAAQTSLPTRGVAPATSAFLGSVETQRLWANIMARPLCVEEMNPDTRRQWNAVVSVWESELTV